MCLLKAPVRGQRTMGISCAHLSVSIHRSCRPRTKWTVIWLLLFFWITVVFQCRLTKAADWNQTDIIDDDAYYSDSNDAVTSKLSTALPSPSNSVTYRDNPKHIWSHNHHYHHNHHHQNQHKQDEQPKQIYYYYSNRARRRPKTGSKYQYLDNHETIITRPQKTNDDNETEEEQEEVIAGDETKVRHHHQKNPHHHHNHLHRHNRHHKHFDFYSTMDRERVIERSLARHRADELFLARLIDSDDKLLIAPGEGQSEGANKYFVNEDDLLVGDSMEEHQVGNLPWPVKHESVMEGDLILGGLMMVHSREDSVTCGPIMPQGGIQALEAMLFAMDRVNEMKLLPNITLGAHILDDCDKDTYGLEMAVDFIKGTASLSRYLS